MWEEWLVKGLCCGSGQVQRCLSSLSVPESSSHAPLCWLPEGSKSHKEKLELVAAFSFFGNVMSMASVQLAGAKRDALLLSFKDAKVRLGETLASFWAS